MTQNNSDSSSLAISSPFSATAVFIYLFIFLFAQAAPGGRICIKNGPPPLENPLPHSRSFHSPKKAPLKYFGVMTMSPAAALPPSLTFLFLSFSLYFCMEKRRQWPMGRNTRKGRNTRTRNKYPFSGGFNAWGWILIIILADHWSLTSAEIFP
jgi:hypothetical protein